MTTTITVTGRCSEHLGAYSVEIVVAEFIDLAQNPGDIRADQGASG
ncbi:hypothetical protein ACFWVM_08410 [Nocardia fluminea]